MKLKIWKSFLKTVAGQQETPSPHIADLAKPEYHRDTDDRVVDVELIRLTKKELDGVIKLAENRQAKEHCKFCKPFIKKAKLFKEVVSSPDTVKLPTPDLFCIALTIIASNLENKWLFIKDAAGHLLPYYIESVVWASANRRGLGSCDINLRANIRGEKLERQISFNSYDLRGAKNLVDALNQNDVYLESDKLVADYKSQLASYIKKHTQTGEQFEADGLGFSVGEYHHRNKETIHLVFEGEPSKVVVDDLTNDTTESGRGERNTGDVVCSNVFWAKQQLKKTEAANEHEEDELYSEEDDAVALPVHPYIRCFHLQKHDYVVVHESNLTPHKWDVTLADKLVLDPEKKELVEILVGGAGEILDDIVKGKTGGVIIMASGEAGTGKTLTAESYSEKIKRPLFIVQCSQLGTDENDIEKQLTLVLTRAIRLKLVLLIDEADVYIHERGADIHQNAIVGVMLRTLERYRGVLFMTTNRATVIDDAILSRLSAHLRYTIPDKIQLRRIFEILADNYKVEVDEFLTELVNEFNGISGRSVKNLLKLVRNLNRLKRERVTIEHFRRAAKFLDLENRKK